MTASHPLGTLPEVAYRTNFSRNSRTPNNPLAESPAWLRLLGTCLLTGSKSILQMCKDLGLEPRRKAKRESELCF